MFFYDKDAWPKWLAVAYRQRARLLALRSGAPVNASVPVVSARHRIFSRVLLLPMFCSLAMAS